MSELATFSELMAIVPRIARLRRRRPGGERDDDRTCPEQRTGSPVSSGDADDAGLTTLRSFPVTSLKSATGEVRDGHVFCRPEIHAEGHCLYGGDFLIGQDGTYLAEFELEITADASSSDPLVILDVYDGLRSKLVLAERRIAGAELAGSRRSFSLEFTATVGQRVEFRAYWPGGSNLKAFGVRLKQRAPGDDAGFDGRPGHRPTGRQVRSVSAIIPCHNGAPWLAEAIRSIQAQTRPVDEIIVVDDCSSDASDRIAVEHGATVIRNAANAGEGFSRNVGLKHARGDFIAWLDADDVWMPHHVETLAALLERHPRATGAFAGVQQFGLRDKLILGYVPLGEPSNVFWPAFCDWLHTTIGSMVSRTALMDIGGFDERERYSVDFDLWLRLSRAHSFVCTHEPTSRWRWHEGQQSVQQEKQLAAVYRFRRRYWERERALGDLCLAEELEICMDKVWRLDMTAAFEAGDEPQIRCLVALAALLPKAPSNLPPQWAARLEALGEGTLDRGANRRTERHFGRPEP